MDDFSVYNAIRVNDALLELSRSLVETVSNAMQQIEPFLEKLVELLKEAARVLSELFKEIIHTYELTELSIPETSVSINGYDDQSQAPPNDKSLKEIAIENLSYNMNRYKNSKFMSLIQTKCPTFFETLIFELFIYWIFKALGMQ